MQGRRGLGESLLAWLDKPGAKARLKEALRAEVERVAALKSDAYDERARTRNARYDLAVERDDHRRTAAGLKVCERELASLREEYAIQIRRHAKLITSIGGVLQDSAVYHELAESYAADCDELRRQIGNARNQLDGAG